MVKQALSAIAFLLTTFAVQFGSHTILNKDFYASVPISRPEPIAPLGLIAMAIVGVALALLFSMMGKAAPNLVDCLSFAWLAGLAIAGYIAIGEVSKYLIPSINQWMLVEFSAALVQYTIFGILLWLIHRRPATV